MKLRRKAVPYLQAEHIHKGGFDGPVENCHCLLGWCRKVFPESKDTYESLHSDHPAVVAICKVAGVSTNGTCLARFNDAKRRSAKDVARVWNRAMAKLGYTEDC